MSHKKNCRLTKIFYQNIFAGSKNLKSFVAIHTTDKNILTEYFCPVRNIEKNLSYTANFRAIRRKIPARNIFDRCGKSQNSKNLRFHLQKYFAAISQKYKWKGESLRLTWKIFLLLLFLLTLIICCISNVTLIRTLNGNIARIFWVKWTKMDQIVV
jgi:hypothetical protein